MRDGVPPILVAAGLSAIFEATEESAESPLSGVVASGTKFETTGICLEEEIKAGLTRATTESHSYKMPEALKIDFLSFLIKTKKHVQKKRPIPSDFPEAPPLKKAIVVEEHDPLTVFLLSSTPSLATSTGVVPLSNSDRETKQHPKRVLSGLVAKGPFA